MRNVFTASLLFPLAVSMPAWADDMQLGEIQVVSTTIDDRFASKRAEPATVHEISGKSVDRRRPENLIEILQSIPGVTADLSSGDEIKIKFRGVENQRYMGEKPGVAIVIDGVPVFERTGKVNIDLDNIESIKIIKGGASYLFGDDGLVGAIIVTTKRGAKYKGITLAADTGSWDYNRQLARAGLAGEWGSAHLQASHRASDDYYWQSAYKTDTIDGNLRLYLSETSDLTFGFEKSDRNKDKHGSVKGTTQAGADPRGIIGRDFTRMYDVDLQKLNATYSKDISARGNLLATVYEYRDHTSYWSNPQRVSAGGASISDAAVGAQDLYTTLNDYHQIQRGVKGEWRAAAGALGWLAGMDLRRNEYLNLNTAKVSYCARTGACPTVSNAQTAAGTILTDNKTNEAVNAAYGELKFMPAPRWTLTANGRIDHIDLDFSSGRTSEVPTPFAREKSFHVTSWRGGANYAAMENVDVFGNLSTGFRAPTAEQLFNGSISPTGGKTENNENLKPEQALNLELGTRAKLALLGVAFDAETAVFQIDRKNYIMSTVGQYSASSATNKEKYDNIGGVRNRGIELSLKSDRKREYTLDLAYTYLSAYFTKYDTFHQTLGSPYVVAPIMVRFNNTGNAVPRVPRHQLNATAGWQPGERFRLALEMDARTWSWADEINQEKWAGRTLFNLHANHDVKGAGAFSGSTWSLFARVNNLFNKRYWSAARGTGDAANYLTGTYDNRYNANDISIVVGKPRSWMAGLSVTF